MNNFPDYNRGAHLKSLTAKLILVLVLITLITMGGFFSLNFFQQSKQMRFDVTSRAENTAFRVSNTVQPTIWNIFQKSVEREYSTEVASAVLDSEINDQYISAIMVYGNFGHLFMGKIKLPVGTIQDFDQSLHASLLGKLDGKISLPIKQGTMTIGSVDVHYTLDPYKENVTETIWLAIVEALILSSIIVVFLFFALRGVLLNPLVSLGMAKETLDALNEGVIVVNREGLVEEVNPAFSDMSEFTRAEILGVSPKQFFLSNEGKTRIETWFKSLREEEVLTGEFRCVKKNGGMFIASTTLSPVMQKTGVILFFVLVFKDITADKIAARRLSELVDEKTALAEKANTANRSKSEFLATMSHELRTPLNAIIGFSEVLQMENIQKSKDQLEEYVSIINSSGNHLLDLINDILDLSKAEAGKLEVDKTVFDVSHLIDECINYMMPSIRKRHINITRKDTSLEIQTDRRLLKQILLNLMSNAVKFNLEGGDLIIEMEEVSDDQVCFTVEDTGIGMSEVDIQKAREPFTQIESSYSKTIEGTGLGLTLVDRFAGLLNGQVEVTSQEHKGTKVRVKIPKFL